MGERTLLIVVSAPSGAGKTTLCDRLLAERDDIVYSVSCTTRAPRGQEVNGRDYFFLEEEDFLKRIANGDFMEHARVHGKWYGTLRSTVEDAMAAGTSVLLDIDVQGAAQIRQYLSGLEDGDPLKSGFLDIFVEPPSIDALRARLVGRAEDQPEEIERRVMQAENEMQSRDLYRVRVVNDDVDQAYEDLRNAILSELEAE
jgi:guanylate kinase